MIATPLRRALAGSLLLLPGIAAAAPTGHAQEVRACWLSQYTYTTLSEAGLRALAANVKAGGMNTVYLNVYGGGVTLWPSQAFAAAGGSWFSPAFDWVRFVAEVLQDEGLAVGAWFEYGLALGPQSHPIAQAHPDWLARDQQGSAVTGENGGFVFLSPGHPEATALIEAMVAELAADYPFDDIQLDRFRWGRRTSGREYGYEAVTAALYQQQTGSPPPGNVNQPAWVAFREGLVNQLVERCYDAIKLADPDIVVSSAPVGYYGITQHMQRWSSWLAGGYMDLAMPQMYRTSLSEFITEFDLQRAEAGPHVDKLGVGYRASEDDDWALVEDQLQYARANGVPHACLWVYHTYTSQVAIQDEIDNLPQPGRAWAAPAVNPFVAPEHDALLVDDADGSPAYVELGGGWVDSAQPDHFGYGSRVAQGGATRTAWFSLPFARGGLYEVSVHYTASTNRNDAARYTVLHGAGTELIELDQRTGGGAWVPLGTWFFPLGPIRERVNVSTAGSDAAEYTSADAVRLELVDALAYNHCESAPNSVGGGAPLFFEGTTHLSANQLVLHATAVPPNQFAIVFYGPNEAQNPFGDGFLCVGAGGVGIFRVGAPVNSGGLGDLLFPVDFTAPPASSGAGQIQPGSSWSFQAWYRDPAAGGSGYNLTNGLRLTFLP